MSTMDINTTVKVSVLTPIYNHPIEYVRECLESLQSQTMQDIEFILIDNGANQESKDLIEEFLAKDSRFKALHIQKNEGYGKAMNLGLDEARGEYIGIVESDDYVSDDMFEKLYQIGHDKNVDFVKSLFYCKYSNRPLRLGLAFKPTEYNRILKNLDVPDFCFKYGAYWSAIYKKDMLIKHNIRYEEMPAPSGEDIMWTLKTYFFCRNLYITNQAFYYHRMDNPNSSIRRSNRINDTMNLYLQLNTYLETKADEMLEEYWQIKTRREFVDIWQSYNAGDVSIRDLKFFFYVTEQLKYNLNKDYVKFNPVDMQHYNLCANHPLRMIGKVLFIKIKARLKRLRATYLGRLFNKCCDKFVSILKSMPGITYILNKKDTLVQKLRNFESSLVKIERLEHDVNAKLYAQAVHPSVFLPYRNCNDGKDVVLIACGPSAEYFSGLENAIYVGVNRSFLKEEINLDYLFIQDDLGEEMDSANAYRPDSCQKFYGILPPIRYIECKKIGPIHPKLIPLSDVQKAKAKQYVLHDYYVPYWPYDIAYEPFKDHRGVNFSAMQFILYTHPKRIFLVGVDCSDEGHFYGGREERFSTAIPLWLNFRDYMVCDIDDIEIISINPVGLRGMFKDIYTQSYLDAHPEIDRTGVEVLDGRCPTRSFE